MVMTMPAATRIEPKNVIEFWNSEAGRDEIYESLRDLYEETVQ